jgi:hypothetical protein
LLSQPTVGHAVGMQTVHIRNPKLNRVVSKNISDRAAHLLALPIQQVLPWRGLEPILKTYNGVTHDVNTAACTD